MCVELNHVRELRSKLRVVVSQPAGIESVDVDVVGVVAEALLGVALPGVVTAAEAEEAETEELTVPGLVELAAVVVVVAAVATVVARLATDQGTAVVPGCCSGGSGWSGWGEPGCEGEEEELRTLNYRLRVGFREGVSRSGIGNS